MSLDELRIELTRLSRVDKLRMMQHLANVLAAEEEQLLDPNKEYPIFTPLGNEEAAKVLLDVLRNAEAADQDSSGKSDANSL
jgi:hypothetical protein